MILQNKSILQIIPTPSALAKNSHVCVNTLPKANRCMHWVLKTRFLLILPVDSQNVTQNRTGHRMHVEGPQICQINRWNNSFQNMYGMNRQKLTVRPGKSILCQKTPQKTAIFVCRNRSYLTLKGPVRQTVDTRSTTGGPWKLWGITLQTSYVEGRWHQNW